MNYTELFVVERSDGQQADIFTIWPSCNGFRLFRVKTQRFVQVENYEKVTTAGFSSYNTTVFSFEEL